LGVGKKKLEVKLDDTRSRRKEILAVGMHETCSRSVKKQRE